MQQRMTWKKPELVKLSVQETLGGVVTQNLESQTFILTDGTVLNGAS